MRCYQPQLSFAVLYHRRKSIEFGEINVYAFNKLRLIPNNRHFLCIFNDIFSSESLNVVPHGSIYNKLLLVYVMATNW